MGGEGNKGGRKKRGDAAGIRVKSYPLEALLQTFFQEGPKGIGGSTKR